jgi:uncharacterized membrane protein YqhA
VTEPARETAATGPAGRYRVDAALLTVRALKVVTLIGVAALLVASATIVLLGAVETLREIVKLVLPGSDGLSARELFLPAIKLVDLVLLASIMQVIAIGLYAQLVDRELPVPRWLVAQDFDELKNRLAGIVIVLLGVLFLEQVFYWGAERDMLSLGIGTAAVIIALAWFLRGQ